MKATAVKRVAEISVLAAEIWAENREFRIDEGAGEGGEPA